MQEGQRKEAQHFANLAAMFIEYEIAAKDVAETIYLDADVTAEGRPYVMMTVEAFNLAAHEQRFTGKPLEITERGVTRHVDVYVKPLTPSNRMN